MPGPIQLFLTGQGEALAIVSAGSYLYKIGLFKNQPLLQRDFDPLAIIPCTFSGYAPIDITGSWGAPVIDPNGNAVATAPMVAWTKSGPTANDAVYGLYFMTSGDAIVAAQYFTDGPYRMSIDGDIIRVTPTIMAGNPIFPESSATNP